MRLPMDLLMSEYVHPDDREPAQRIMQEAIEARLAAAGEDPRLTALLAQIALEPAR